MNDELLAKRIKDYILVKRCSSYFETLDNTDDQVFVNESWQKTKILYGSLSKENKDNLKEFMMMAMTESVTDLLAFIDGIASFEEQEYPFELHYNNKKISGSIQEYLLMDIEDNGI